MAWNDAVITNAGVKMYSKALLNDGIVITKALGGGFTYPSDILITQTRVTSPETELTLIETTETENGRQINMRIDNVGLKTPFTLRQVGIYAREKNSDDEKLIAIIQDEQGINIPLPADNPEFILEFGFIMPFSNECEINVSLDPNMLVTYKDILKFTATIDKVEDLNTGLDSKASKAELAAETQARIAADNNLQQIINNLELSGLIIQTSAPTGNANKLWINPTSGIIHFWYNSAWKPAAGTFIS